MQVAVHPHHRLADLLPCFDALMHLLQRFQRVMPFDCHRQRPFEHRRKHHVGAPLYGRAVGHMVGQPGARQKQRARFPPFDQAAMQLRR